MHDCLIVGGGVIGLSLAYELAGLGQKVHVIDRGQIGREASWAGAGILTDAVFRPNDPPLDQLTGLSSRLHAEWAEQLREQTGIDNGYRRCGGVYVARDLEAAAELEQTAKTWHARGIAAEMISPEVMFDLEPAMAGSALAGEQSVARGAPSRDMHSAYLSPGECQLRNPRHLKALAAACGELGVEISSGVAAEDFEVRSGRVERVLTSSGPITAGNVCLTTGSWTAGISRRLGVTVDVSPVRGQMVLLRGQRPILTRIINEGRRYLVPRTDGRLLIGSTEENTGFIAETTAEGIAGLLRFGLSLVPATSKLYIERTWAGLRPGAARGLPYLGQIPDIKNAFIAAGHFRSGLHLSTGTARVMQQLILGQAPDLNLSPFAVEQP